MTSHSQPTDPEKSMLRKKPVALENERRQVSQRASDNTLDQSIVDAVPSHFLNTNFQSLLNLRNAAERSTPRYQIGPSIGLGGIGEVFRVFDRTGQRSLALKTLQRRFVGDQAAVVRFMREGLLTGTLQHPGVPPVYDQGRFDDQTPFFTMKLVEGQTLHQILQSRSPGAEDLGALVGVFESVAQTLAYAHSQNVVHRDLKPQNIMVGRFGEVQVMDWGLAKRLGEDLTVVTDPDSVSSSGPANPKIVVPSEPDSASSATPDRSDLTTAGDIVGTPGYMAPEQARGEVESVDKRVDVFALGAILFQILRGRTLFEADSRADMVEKARRGDLSDALGQLDQHRDDRELVSLCRQCLATDPASRPADASYVAEATTKFIASLERRIRQAEIQRSRSEVRIVESRKRQRWIVAMTSVLTLLAILSSLIIGFQWRKATRAVRAESEARDVAEKEIKTTTEINEFLNRVLSSNLPEQLGHDVTLREVVDQTVSDLDGKFTQRPRVEGSLRRTLGESYRWLGEPDIAEQQYRLSLAALEIAEPFDELEVLETKDRLAGVLRSRGDEGDFEESKRLRTEVLRRTRALLGESHERTITAMNNLGTVLIELNELDAAAELFRNALRRIDASPNPEQHSRPSLLANLADVDRMKGHWDSAESIYLQVIDAPEASTYEKDLAMIQLGQMLHAAQRYDESLRYLRRSFELREAYYGPRHPLTLSAMRKMSRVLDESERYDELLELLGDSLDRHAKELLPAAGPICEARSLRAKALIGLGRDEEAEAYLKETIELISRERGDQHKYAQAAKQQLKAFRTAD
ncbi:serine/threonine-protein kinase [Rhodopirellula sp. JC639]|uniref:serine/threonine-protein kinase n=1 Tax=Stieleria mannarensis TaxID=2755585 RepID=UPI0016009968|nr:serine/threonine-protein kinase [Rhodopirellula sp. JC639]